MNRSSLLHALLATAFLCLSGAPLARDTPPDACGSKAEPTLKPGSGNDLYVKDGVCTVNAGKYSYGAVTIYPGAELRLTDANIDLSVKSIIVQSGATLSAGSSSAPIGGGNIGNRVVISLTGNKSAGAAAAGAHVHDHADPRQLMASDDCSTIDKGIAVMSGGTLRLYGAKGVPSRGGVSWTHLAAPAGPARYEATDQNIQAPVVGGKQGQRIKLARDVRASNAAWKETDWIVIAGTSFSPFEGEFVQIDSFEDSGDGGVYVNLKTALKHYHFGGPDPGPAAEATGARSASYSAGKEKNYGVDERAEVGLVTRNIRLTALTADAIANPNDANRNWGGETKACRGFSEFAMEGVEIEKFGKERLGSYPIHFHMTGDVKAPQIQKVNANSIHHSYNKCITVHSTSDVSFENNVCARITGHIFYQEIGDEFRTRFVNNLGIGAMNNNFGLPSGAQPGSTTGFWEGDYLAAGLGYTGLNIRNNDAQANPVHGGCYLADGSGALYAGRDPYPNEQDPRPCDQSSGSNSEYYFEPPTGFWIINPSAILEGNSIAGCQGLGRGYWYVPPANYTPRVGPTKIYTYKFQPVGIFRNNRAHGCYDGIFGEPEEPTTSAEQIFPKKLGDPDGFNLIARFEGFTASRIRNRAVWVRPMWFTLENARIATSREGVTLLTSGGLDGNGPGVWGLLKNSVVVALSANNVDRWGPCADKAAGAQEFPGCVDRNPNARDRYIKGYPSPAWNFAGVYIYDGPVRIHDSKFVRFRKSLTDPTPLLTKGDAQILENFKSYYADNTRYGGDAALGWFQNNQSAYPTATEVKGLEFVETDLRHQVFTDKVNFGKFDDGDKNTAVIDKDGSLTGYKVVKGDGTPAPGQHPISLNNLPFNASSNAVDECLSEGSQDTLREGRPTSLISPGNMATLEFGALYGTDGLTRGPLSAGLYRLTQFMTFTKDYKDYGEHQSMTLHSRNDLAVWEPKVTSGLGYTVTVSSASGQYPAVARPSPGIPKFINVGLTDAVKPNMDKEPFFVRLGVCYTNKNKTFPQSPKFKIYRGYKSWGGNGTTYDDPTMRQYFNKLNNLWDGQTCDNLDYQVLANTGQLEGNPVPPRNDLGCPADGVVIKPASGCPAGSTRGDKKDGRAQDVCIFETDTLEEEKDFTKLADSDGTPVMEPHQKYYYDSATGMLYFYVVQDVANVAASSPIGSCVDGSDPACPAPGDGLFACPAQGCFTYTVEIDDATYDPGESFCGGSNSPTAIYSVQNGKYVLPEPANSNKLAYLAGGSVVTQEQKSSQGFSHRTAATPPVCTGTP